MGRGVGGLSTRRHGTIYKGKPQVAPACVLDQSSSSDASASAAVAVRRAGSLTRQSVSLEDREWL